MCGRFALGIPKIRLEEVFEIVLPDSYSPRYNIAPGSDVLTVAAPEGTPRPAFLRWGLVPNWAGDANIGHSMINARVETVFDKPAFEMSVRMARCLVPAQAFYEWKSVDGRKQPYAVGTDDGSVFAMAGITSNWEDHATGEILDTFSILTCPPNALMADIHDRMPVILPAEAWSRWLDPDVTEPEHLQPLLEPYPAAAMRVWPVGSGVNSPANDSREVLERVDVMRQGRLF